jgi:hypothetical protein
MAGLCSAVVPLVEVGSLVRQIASRRAGGAGGSVA